MLGWASALIVSAAALSAASLVASVWLVVVAFRKRTAWGLVVLLVPFAAVAFAIRHWRSARKPFLASLGTAAAASLLFLGAAGIGAAAISKQAAGRMPGGPEGFAAPTRVDSLLAAERSREPATTEESGAAEAPPRIVVRGVDPVPAAPPAWPAPGPEALPFAGAEIGADGYAEIHFRDARRAVGRSVRLLARDGRVHEGDLVGATAGSLEIENAFRSGTVSVEFHEAEVEKLLVKVVS